MDRTVLSTEGVQSALHEFVLVRLNLAEHPELSKRYAVYGTPTYLVVDGKGNPVARTEGMSTVDQFTRFLNRAATRNAGTKLPSAPR